MVAGGCGACLRSASRAMPRVFWTCTTRHKTCGRRRRPGWMGGPPRPARGLPGPGTAYGMAGRTGSWPTWRTPWTSRGCLQQPETLCARCMPPWNGTASTSTMPWTRNWACLWAVGWSRVRANGLFNNGSRGSGCAGVRTVSTISCTSDSLGSTDALRPCSSWPSPRTRNCAPAQGVSQPLEGHPAYSTGQTSSSFPLHIWRVKPTLSANHLVRQNEERRGKRHAEGLGGLEVEDQLELHSPLDGQVSGLGAFEDLVHIGGRAPIQVAQVRRIAHEAARLHELPPPVHPRQLLLRRHVHNPF